MDAWLYFLSSDKPEELIAMYNEPLALYDKNTVELMIEEQQEEIRRLEEEAQKREEELRLNKEELRAKDDELEALRRELAKWTENV